LFFIRIAFVRRTPRMGASATSSVYDGEELDDGLAACAALIPRFSHQEIVAATASFSSANKLGAGSSAEVYRGRLHGSTDVAIKVLQGDFLDELKVLSRFQHHPNLIALLGWATDDAMDDKYLVYEFLAGGDVGKRLYKAKQGRQSFSGQHRSCVASDVSCGLAFMMSSHPKTFHRDIKPSNILLATNGTAKLADFGLAGSTIGEDGEECLSFEHIMGGTPGYICPEYARTGEVTEQSEVYSFGITVLELLINELPARQKPHGGLYFPIVEAVRPAETGALGRIVAKLDQTAGWPRPTADEIARLALRCVHSKPLERPLFAELVSDLRRLCQPSAVPAQEPVKPRSTAPLTLPAGFAAAASAIGTQQPQGFPLLAANAANAAAAAYQASPKHVQQAGPSSALIPAKQAASIQQPHYPGGVHMASSVTPPVTPSAMSQTTVTSTPPVTPSARLSPHQGGKAASFPQNSPKFENELSVYRSASDPGGVLGVHNALTGPHTPREIPMLPQSVRSSSKHQRQPSGDWVRIACTYAKGIRVSDLPAPTRCITISAGDKVELGRKSMPGFFERLLAGDKQWLGYISRSHCQLSLVSLPTTSPTNSSSSPALKVENLSANAIYVNGRAVSKGNSDILSDGGTLEFAAKPGGNGEWTRFLVFSFEN
jgi:serine/threonine protein kinase